MACMADYYTAKNVHVAASLQSRNRYQDMFASLFGLMITSLLQAVNRLAACCELHAESANISSCSIVDTKSTGLIQLVGNLHGAGKLIHNLDQVCGVFSCVL